MNVKITLFIESVQEASKYASAALGWTETYYGFSNTFTDVDSWFTAPDVATLIELRSETLPLPYRISWLRIADEGNFRSFKVKALDSIFGRAIAEVVSTPNHSIHGQVQCALLVDLVRLPDAGPAQDHTHHRKFLMRGLPANVIDGNVLRPEGFNWLRIKQFLDWLAVHETGEPVPRPNPPPAANTTIGLRYQDPANANWLASPSVQNDPGDSKGIVMGALLGGTAFSRFELRRFPDKMRMLNRTWHWRGEFAGPPPATSLGRTRRDLEVINYTPPGPGQYREVLSRYGVFQQYTIIGLRTKKTGRLFRQLRGRSPNR